MRIRSHGGAKLVAGVARVQQKTCLAETTFSHIDRLVCEADVARQSVIFEGYVPCPCRFRVRRRAAWE